MTPKAALAALLPWTGVFFFLASDEDGRETGPRVAMRLISPHFGFHEYRASYDDVERAVVDLADLLRDVPAGDYEQARPIIEAFWKVLDAEPS